MNMIRSVSHLAAFCSSSLSQRIYGRFVSSTFTTSTRNFATDYDPNPEFKSPSPYKSPEQYRFGYKGKIYTGGLLPRHDDVDVKPLPLNDYRPRDVWAVKRGLFGQNDYIDILSDGDLEPRHLTRGPKWLRGGFQGDEFMTLTRRLKYQYLELQEYQPTRYHQIKKRVNYLYRRLNHRSHRGWYKGEY